MDVIIEGKITKDSKMDEILRTCTEIKSVNPILRINDNESSLQGRIGLSQGGYIIGGKVPDTGEIGYEAIRKLLAVVDGNYAILDPGNKHFGDVNQSLWLKVDKILPLLPDLPDKSDGLVDKHPQEELRKSAEHQSLHSTLESKKTVVEDEPTGKSDSQPVTVDATSPSRKIDMGNWRLFRWSLVVVAFFAVVLGLAVNIGSITKFVLGLFG